MSNHKYSPGDIVEVYSSHYGNKPGKVREAFYKTGIPFYLIDIQGIGQAEIREGRIVGRLRSAQMSKSFRDRVDEEMKKRMSMTSDEYNEAGTPPKGEVQNEPTAPDDRNDDPEGVQVPGGAPGPLSPEQIKKNPNEIVNPEAVKDMGAKHKFAFDPKKGRQWWDSVTGGKTHKIKACMDAAKSFADDPGAFCGSLAEEVGYKPE